MEMATLWGLQAGGIRPTGRSLPRRSPRREGTPGGRESRGGDGGGLQGESSSRPLSKEVKVCETQGRV